jgi:hypothetical protein
VTIRECAFCTVPIRHCQSAEKLWCDAQGAILFGKALREAAFATNDSGRYWRVSGARQCVVGKPSFRIDEPRSARARPDCPVTALRGPEHAAPHRRPSGSAAVRTPAWHWQLPATEAAAGRGRFSRVPRARGSRGRRFFWCEKRDFLPPEIAGKWRFRPYFCHRKQPICLTASS